MANINHSLAPAREPKVPHITMKMRKINLVPASRALPSFTGKMAKQKVIELFNYFFNIKTCIHFQ